MQNISISLGMYRVSIIQEKKNPFWKWNDPEICSVKWYSRTIPNEMETEIFPV